MESRKNKVRDRVNKVRDNYKKETPWRWRKIGDMLLVIGSTITSISAFNGSPILTTIAAISTGLGKIITDFTTN